MSDVSTPPGAAGPVGTIHDLGYKRYVGTRRPQSTRWRVIARNQASTTWRTFFRFKAWLILAAANTAAFVILLTLEQVRSAFQRMREFTAESPETLIVALSFNFLPMFAFIATLTASASVIAGDKQSGAFTFYFARPVRPIDYVVGKVVGMFAMFALIFVAGPVIIAGVRVGMSGSASEVLANLDVIGRVLVAGVLAALAYAAVPLAISSLVPTKRYALALWATYYLVVGNIATVIGYKTGAPWISALNIPDAVRSLAFGILDIRVLKNDELIGLPYAAAGLVAHATAAIAIVYLRLRSERHSGIGGAS